MLHVLDAHEEHRCDYHEKIKVQPLQSNVTQKQQNLAKTIPFLVLYTLWAKIMECTQNLRLEKWFRIIGSNSDQCKQALTTDHHRAINRK